MGFGGVVYDQPARKGGALAGYKEKTLYMRRNSWRLLIRPLKEKLSGTLEAISC
jgi:hypothetical protein